MEVIDLVTAYTLVEVMVVFLGLLLLDTYSVYTALLRGLSALSKRQKAV